MIEEFDRQHVGVSQPTKTAPKSSAAARQAKPQPAVVDANANDSTPTQDAAVPGTHVQVSIGRASLSKLVHQAGSLGAASLMNVCQLCMHRKLISQASNGQRNLMPYIHACVIHIFQR